MIYETIVSTVDAHGNAHVTPFGIQMQKGLIIISPYKPSRTLDNILTTGYAVVNVVDDVRLFAAALTGRYVGDLVPADMVTGLRLTDCLSHKELKLIKVQDDAVRPRLFLEIVHEVEHRAFQGFNRAQAAVIELAVLVSRLKRLPLDKITNELEYLKIAIDKTAGPRELEAWQWLVEAVENHKAELNLENLA
ncbi:MAG: DUF447 domain-containing protein [Betaproteobacteria bacterium HGW-Betaproteobacteria-22]|nr:MAG: DUF447 domain-containing protein [Betaproteobacteria bacterium HGW-Betaproteobacteria-22]